MNVEIYYIIFIFIFGLVLGSFYNVVGYRLPNDMSIVFPSSFCPNCKSKLKFYELIPLFSYVFQRGKCNHCKKKIPLFYPFFEFLTAVLFVISYLIFGFNIKFFIAITFISILIIITISDIKYFIIPDEVLIFGSIFLIIELFISSYIGNLGLIKGVVYPLLNGILSFASLYVFKIIGDFIFKRECLGGGDIKLMFLIGLILGYDMCIVTIFLASFIALVPSIISLVKNDDNILPFGPYLSMASIIILFTGMSLNSILSFFISI